MNEVLSASMATRRFNLALFGSFAVLALLLAAVGVHGVTAYSVAQRTRELGIRAALGATRGELMRLVVAHGASLAAAGLALGTAAALALGNVMATLLFGNGARDSLTFAECA